MGLLRSARGAAGGRLAAFYQAMVRLLERHGHLALAGETGGRRYETGAYAASALHVRTLLDEAGLIEPGSGGRAARRWHPTSSLTSARAACRLGGSRRRPPSLLAQRIAGGLARSRWASAISAAIRSSRAGAGARRRFSERPVTRAPRRAG